MPSPLCTECGARHDDRLKCLDVIITGISSLLMRIGQIGTCKGCQAQVFWLNHLNGKKAPYDRNGQNHFISCAASERFK